MGKSETNETSYSCPYMPECELLKSTQTKMPELSNRIKHNYCTVPTARCARRRLSNLLGPERVPPLMLPEQFQWADQIIQEFEPAEHDQTAANGVQ